MAIQGNETIEAFGATFTGRALLPGDAEYDASRSVWNGVIDRKPAVIAACSTTAQVADAVRFARKSGLEIAVRGGGHNYAGLAVCEGGVMIHLGAMKKVEVDAGARRATCGGGTTWADLDGATQQYGLAAPGGFISHTGVAGLTLGGGIGWFTKRAGLSCDNLMSAEVVTADGRVVRASEKENPELLWGLRGGGGNFGVVTSFEFALHPVGPEIHVGLFFFGMENGAEALRYARHYIQTLPDQATAFLGIGLSAPAAPFVPAEFQGTLGHAVIVVGFGTSEEHQAIVAPLRHAVTPLFELVTPMPFVALQQMFNEGLRWGTLGYEKALYLETLSDPAIEVISEFVPKKGSLQSFCPTFTLNGAYRNPGETDTAFGGSRLAGHVFNINASTMDRGQYEAERAWVRSFWEAMRPHAMSSGSYVNFMSEVDESRTRTSYGAEKYQRLARLKAQFDPDNVFHLNVNVKPAESEAPAMTPPQRPPRPEKRP